MIAAVEEPEYPCEKSETDEEDYEHDDPFVVGVYPVGSDVSEVASLHILDYVGEKETYHGP